ncbi:MAG: hypothetical protein CMH49_09560 [Myxococcales bacterium]|nr:hypothetical protein [Myxococcales bacterium]
MSKKVGRKTRKKANRTSRKKLLKSGQNSENELIVDETNLTKVKSRRIQRLLRFLRQSRKSPMSNVEGEGVDTLLSNIRVYVQEKGMVFYGLWDYLIIILSLVSVGMITIQLNDQTDPELHKLLQLFDLIICVFFFVDFLIRLLTAPIKKQYLKWGWIDLISSLPMVDQLRWGRLWRLLRIVRAIKGTVRGQRKLKVQDPFISVIIITFLCIFMGTLSILYLESGVEGANIRTARDALWWVFTTVTTVGYGDFTPVTNEGRLLAVFLMSAGIGIFGIFSVQCTQLILNKQKDEDEEELNKLRQELSEVKSELVEIKGLLTQLTDHYSESKNNKANEH